MTYSIQKVIDTQIYEAVHIAHPGGMEAVEEWIGTTGEVDFSSAIEQHLVFLKSAQGVAAVEPNVFIARFELVSADGSPDWDKFSNDAITAQIEEKISDLLARLVGSIEEVDHQEADEDLPAAEAFGKRTGLGMAISEIQHVFNIKDTEKEST